MGSSDALFESELEEDFVLPPSGGGGYEVIEEGPCNSVCVEVLKPRMRNTFGDEKKLQTRIIFETDKLRSDGSRHTVSTRWLTVSTHEKSNMGKFLRQWLAEEFPSMEVLKAGTYHPRKELPGKTAALMILHEADKKDPDVTWARIVSCKPGKVALEPSGQHVMEEDKEPYEG